MKQKIIITGGSGLLAVNWAYKIKETFDVLLFTHYHSVNIPGVSTKVVDLNDVVSIAKEITAFNANVIVHAAGMTNVDECEKKPELAYRVNVEITENVARACADTDKSLVHISTDHLFDGLKPLVEETEPVKPINVYGHTKAQAEEKVSNVTPDALIIRTNFYGWGNSYKASLSDWVIRLLEDNKEVPAFDDSYFTPIVIDQLIYVIHELINLGHSGVYNICGGERISKYNFAKTIAYLFNFDPELVKKSSITDANLFARRPIDMSLSNKKVSKLLNKNVGEFEAGLQILFRNKINKNVLRDTVYNV